MKRYKSKQGAVQFLKIKSPITIDKSEEWGEGNIQEFPNGAFLKVTGGLEITHGVQPNKDFSAPEGWTKEMGVSFFRKEDILARLIEEQGFIDIDTLDGKMRCQTPGYFCQNLNNPKDQWVQPVNEFERNYEIA